MRSGSDAQDPKYRLGVGIVSVNQEGKIFVGKRIGYSEWGMPQGGVDFYHKKPESFLDAARRELWEEVGVKKSLSTYCPYKTLLRNDFPPFSLWKLNFWSLRLKGKNKFGMGFIFLETTKILILMLPSIQSLRLGNG